MNEIILDKIIKQSQFYALIAKIESKVITKTELLEDINSYYSFTECLWELYIKTKGIECSANLLILQQRAEIQELKKEIEKLNNVLNDNR